MRVMIGRTERGAASARRRRIGALGPAVSVALLASACGGGGTGVTATPTAEATQAPPTQIGTVRVSASECTLDLVDGPINPGLVTITAVNETDARAMFDMWRITEGSTYEQLARYIKKERRLAEAGDPGLGHPWFVADLIRVGLGPGESGALVGTVISGTWGIVCIRKFERSGIRPFALVGPVEVE